MGLLSFSSLSLALSRGRLTLTSGLLISSQSISQYQIFLRAGIISNSDVKCATCCRPLYGVVPLTKVTSLICIFVVLRSRASAITYAHSCKASLAQLGTSPQQVKTYMSFWYSPKYQSFSHPTVPTQQSLARHHTAIIYSLW